MARIGLVLGAGGVVGGAWHAGVVAALAEATGWDARTADVVVGTSAGAVLGASLRCGLPPADHLAEAIGEPLSAEGSALMARMHTKPGFGRSPRRGLPLPANPALLRSLAPWERRPLVAMAGLLPEGTFDTASIGARVDELAGNGRWPDQPLWICAVRLRTGRLVAFGRDDVEGDPSLGTAVAASAAIPGFFAPVRIGGRAYVDGGVHSPTNADLLVDAALDLVVVSAPMAGGWRAMRVNPATLGRFSSRRRLDREVAAVRAAGTPVLVLQPGPDDTPIMDGGSMDVTRREPVARRARESALVQLARDETADRVALLR